MSAAAGLFAVGFFAIATMVDGPADARSVRFVVLSLAASGMLGGILAWLVAAETRLASPDRSLGITVGLVGAALTHLFSGSVFTLWIHGISAIKDGQPVSGFFESFATSLVITVSGAVLFCWITVPLALFAGHLCLKFHRHTMLAPYSRQVDT